LQEENRIISTKLLAAIVGQLISAQGVFGDIVRLHTRYVYQCINERASWKASVYVTKEAESEISFWVENVEKFNQDVHKFSQLTEKVADIKMFCDASDVGFGGYLVSDEHLLIESVMHDSWDAEEASSSSTWRELEAVNRVICHNVDLLKEKNCSSLQ
jgi:hypothetical protein